MSLLRSARAVPRSGAREKAVRAMAEAADLRSSAGAFGQTRWQRLKLRRVLIAAAVAIVLVAPALWLTSHRGPSAALANMARAMAKVQSAHFTGVSLDRESGAYVSVEGWVKGPTKLRMKTEGVKEEVHDGATWTEINLRSNPVLVHIYPEKKSHLGSGLTYLDLFSGSTAAQMATTPLDARLTSSRPVTLPDGRAALVVEVTARAGQSVCTIDSRTDLLISWESYRNGKLDSKVERVEYDVEIPDSIFTAEIPAGAMVIDATKPSRTSAEQQAVFAEWKKAAERLPGAVRLSWFGPGDHGSCGTPFHRNLAFEVLGNDGMILVYLPDWNVYRVFGTAMVHEDADTRNPGPIVENGEYVPPTPPEVTVEQWKADEARELAEEARRAPTPEVRAQWAAKGRELKALGAKHICQAGGQYWPVGNMNGGCTFEALDGKENDVWYSPARGEYYILGKARISNRKGFDRTVENGWVKVPGPPPELPEEAN